MGNDDYPIPRGEHRAAGGDNHLIFVEQGDDQKALSNFQVLQGNAQMRGIFVEDELSGLHIGVGDAVQGRHDAAALILKAPNQPENPGHGDELGGHHAVQTGGLDHGGAVDPVALGHHLAQSCCWA